MKQFSLTFIVLLAIMASSAEAEGYVSSYAADIRYSISVKGDAHLLSTVHGYDFGNSLFIGGGIGMMIETGAKDISDTKYSLPVFANVRYSFLPGKVKPFVELSAGGLYNFTDSAIGYMVMPNIGVSWSRIALNIGVNYHKCHFNAGMAGNTYTMLGLTFRF